MVRLPKDVSGFGSARNALSCNPWAIYEDDKEFTVKLNKVTPSQQAACTSTHHQERKRQKAEGKAEGFSYWNMNQLQVSRCGGSGCGLSCYSLIARDA